MVFLEHLHLHATTFPLRSGPGALLAERAIEPLRSPAVKVFDGRDLVSDAHGRIGSGLAGGWSQSLLVLGSTGRVPG